MEYIKKLSKGFRRTKPKPKPSSRNIHESRKICSPPKQKGTQRQLVYLIYEYNSIKAVRPHALTPPIFDYAGFFSSKTDAENVAKCLNNIFLNVEDFGNTYELIMEYRVTSSDILKDTNIVYKVVAQYEAINHTKKDDTLNNYTRVRAIAKTLEDARLYVKARGPNPYQKIYIKKYYLNDIMPTMNIDDYDIDLHKKNMKIITNELRKHAHKKKMQDVLDNINLLEYAPPSRVLPKGGRKYQKMVNSPTFRKRWEKYDKTMITTI